MQVIDRLEEITLEKSNDIIILKSNHVIILDAAFVLVVMKANSVSGFENSGLVVLCS